MLGYKNEYIKKEDLDALESIELRSLFASGNIDVIKTNDLMNRSIANYGANKQLEGMYSGYCFGAGVALASMGIAIGAERFINYISPKIKRKLRERKLKKAMEKLSN